MIIRYKVNCFDVTFIILMNYETCQSVKNPRLIGLDSIVVLDNVMFFLLQTCVMTLSVEC
jgi:hypothetical protein